MGTTTLRTRTLSALSWSGGTQIVRQILSFIISIILARLLTPDVFGVVGMVAVFTGFAEIFADLGFGAALIQKRDLREEHLNAVFWLNVATGALLTGIFSFCSPLIASFYNEPVLRSLTIIISLNFLLGSFKIVHLSLLQKRMEFRQLASVQIVSLLVSGSIAVVLAAVNGGVWSLVAQGLTSTLISVALLWSISPWRPDWSLNAQHLRELLQFSLNLVGFHTLNYWTRNLDNLLIGRFVNATALGLYGRAYALMLLPIANVNGMFSQVMFPSLSLIQDDIIRVKRIYLQMTRCVALFTFPLMIGLLSTARLFILAVYGEKWIAMVPLLKIFSLVGLTQSIGTTVGWIYTSQGRTDIMFRWTIVNCMVRGLSFIIGLHWGGYGIAWAYATTTFILSYPSWFIAGRLIHMRVSEIMRNLFGIFCVAMAMGGVVWGVEHFFPAKWFPGTALGVQVLIGVVTYLLLLHFFQVQAYIELIDVIQEKLSQTKFSSQV